MAWLSLAGLGLFCDGAMYGGIEKHSDLASLLFLIEFCGLLRLLKVPGHVGASQRRFYG